MDQRLFFLINRFWTHPTLDRIMAAASSLDLWLPLLLVLVALVAWRGRTRARSFLLCLGLTLAINDALIGDALKHLVHRPRPFQAMPGVRQLDLDHRAHPRFLALMHPLNTRISTDATVAATPPDAGRSFPSNHTTNNFCAATLLTLFYRRRGWWYFFPAVLVGYSRVYVGAHWPSDVFASAVLAIGWVLAAAALVRWWLHRHDAPHLSRLRAVLAWPSETDGNHSA